MKPEWIARQSRCPSGWVGEVVARVMARDTQPANVFALRLLRLEPGASVLEIGCGNGKTLQALARGVRGGFVAGIDPSAVMARLSARRLRREIERGRAEVHRAEAARLPFDAGRFDAVLCVHVLYFWRQPARELAEVRRVLRPGGTLLLGFRPDAPEARASLPGSVYHLRTVEEVEKMLREAGFEIRPVREEVAGGARFACVVANAPVEGGG